MADNPEPMFVAALRLCPSDESTRLVYADWLEEHGDPRVGIVRDIFDLGGVPSELAWRRIVCRAKIEHSSFAHEAGGCGAVGCPGYWDRLAATDDAGVRECTVCSRSVHYCVELADVARCGSQLLRTVFDRGLDPRSARTTFDRSVSALAPTPVRQS